MHPDGSYGYGGNKPFPSIVRTTAGAGKKGPAPVYTISWQSVELPHFTASLSRV